MMHFLVLWLMEHGKLKTKKKSSKLTCLMLQLAQAKKWREHLSTPSISPFLLCTYRKIWDYKPI